MPNATVISVIGHNISSELEMKFTNWFDAAYAPVHMSTSLYLGIERYKIINGNPVYPENLSIFHCQNLQGILKTIDNPDRLAVVKDVNTTFKRIECVWFRKGFELIKSFRPDTQIEGDTRVDNAQVLHMEVLRLAPEQEEKYNQWLVRWAYPVYIPILMKLPGLKAYNRFHHSGQDFQESKDYRARETEYPTCLSMLYFEDVKAFENYERSPELIAFREAIRMNFPGSLDYKWYVQYQLVKSWRK
jgi:hypothetical protein